MTCFLLHPFLLLPPQNTPKGKIVNGEAVTFLVHVIAPNAFSSSSNRPDEW